MKVKVGDKIYSGEDQPVMVILTEQDKYNIENMLPDCTKYAMYPDGEFSAEEIHEWMDWGEEVSQKSPSPRTTFPLDQPSAVESAAALLEEALENSENAATLIAWFDGERQIIEQTVQELTALLESAGK
jgi:hypothetical protein